MNTIGDQALIDHRCWKSPCNASEEIEILGMDIACIVHQHVFGNDIAVVHHCRMQEDGKKHRQDVPIASLIDWIWPAADHPVAEKLIDAGAADGELRLSGKERDL